MGEKEKMNVLHAGAIIKRLLLDSSANEHLKGRIYPIVAPSTNYPFVVYRRSSVKPVYTKDRLSPTDTATIELAVMETNYNRSVTVMNAVFEALQGYSGTVEDIEVSEIRMISSEEDFEGDCYNQIMIFEIDVINN